MQCHPRVGFEGFADSRQRTVTLIKVSIRDHLAHFEVEQSVENTGRLNDLMNPFEMVPRQKTPPKTAQGLGIHIKTTLPKTLALRRRAVERMGCALCDGAVFGHTVRKSSWDGLRAARSGHDWHGGVGKEDWLIPE